MNENVMIYFLLLFIIYEIVSFKRSQEMTTGIPDPNCPEKYKLRFKALTLVSRNGEQLKALKKQLIHLVGKWNEEQICKTICKIYDIGFRDSL